MREEQARQLADALRKQSEELRKDQNKAKKLLQDAGILDQDGNMTPFYREGAQYPKHA
ncbi:hypothetical protein QCD60_24165 [Pokkaliibacter sp. MBI-7]|uniref:hypothetical protein n=1 Tax=Pokkaliibacter sp. MBI-7 TaxID=3040600 RepID=UPI00244906C1|nr:hypothetical protein [Pokkaliibacter sp. MBI-7]MDH2435625.1 hypothetical protein [Pokkaliibacter sp. MBI-7]